VGFALGPGEHFFHVVEAADQARAQIEALGAEAGVRPWPTSRRVEAGPEKRIHGVTERGAASPLLSLQADGDVVVEGESRAHVLMLRT